MFEIVIKFDLGMKITNHRNYDVRMVEIFVKYFRHYSNIRAWQDLVDLEKMRFIYLYIDFQF